MEPEAPYTPPEQDLDLRPRLKVKRLNRLAVLLVALVAILVLWGAYFVLSSRPRFGSPDQAAKRLRRNARRHLDRDAVCK